jgi:hypothetical protein
MEPPVDVDAVALRASQYWMEDGLVEIMFGLMMAILSGLFLVAGALPRGLDLIATFGVQAAAVAVTLLILGGFKRLKKRITFPRTGYVALQEPTRKHGALMWAMFAVVAVTFTLLVPLRSFAMLAFALAFAICLLGGGLQSKEPSMVWEGFLTLLFAACMSWFPPLRGMRGMGALMILVGVSMAIIGAFRLRSFVKANPRSQEIEA